MVRLAILCSHSRARTYEFSIYQIFIGEKSFLGVGHLAVALWDDAVISKTDTDSVILRLTLTKWLHK